MPPDDLERTYHDRSETRPTTSRPMASRATNIVESEIGEPCSCGNPEDDRTQPQMMVVRRQAADERRRFFGDDAGRAERQIRPKPPNERDGPRLRRRSLQQS